jgi:hypothetical protein
MKRNRQTTKTADEASIAANLATLARLHTESGISSSKQGDLPASSHLVAASSDEQEGIDVLKSPRPALDLSFMRRRTPHGTGIEYWNVQSVGDYKVVGNYTTDCGHGRELATEYLDYIGAHPTHGNRTLLGAIVVDMIEKRAPKGLVIGFMGAINEYAMASARLLAGEFKVDPVELGKIEDQEER